ncbi:pescadillo homolog [Daucus carota subsp. sativus]|uniref:pescadillo homolog n=1 Tax=Daucus carota subsp. sativus TaxID=79200 RepID=UPI0007F0200E|nr:PREDICTED: pescadillo homolog [Daucus carota subsp. sativus]
MPKHYRPAGKKKEGNAAKYMTRSQAIKYLQVSLSLFRKLCILKGVFPRVPKKKVKGNHHTYYHVKDIAFLKHEPLVEKFRDMRTYDRKVKKAESKKNRDLAERLLTRKPTYTLDRLIRERYPKFIDALRDLDDCLSMVHLFAALPAIEREKIEVKRVHNCRRLSHEWQAYISRCHKLRKVFISVKGIYYQAEVEGQKVTWLTPHALQQVLPDDVDYKVMLTFLEFYETLLAFVNFKIYNSINVKYPPILDPRLEALAADLYALSRYFDANSKAPMVSSQDAALSESNQVKDKNNDAELHESELRLAQLQHQLPSNEPGALMRLVEDAAGEDEDDEETKECKTLFKDMKFFLSREVPRESLLFVIPAFGGVVSWEGEGSPYKETDQGITYQIVDRPTQGHKFFTREYVQPQWVFDCINARIILPTEDYMVGRVPPPHLSPFVVYDPEDHVPEYAETIKRLQAAARQEVLPMPGVVGVEDLENPQNLLDEAIIDRTEAIEVAKRKEKLLKLQKQHLDELNKEVKGEQLAVESDASDKKPVDTGFIAADSEQAIKDAADITMVGVSRKKRELYKAMQIGNERKKAKTQLLKERKRLLDEAKKSNT